ncbi:MAG: glycoside hydrolase family 3 protein [Huintestinicola sp.]
MAKKILDWEKYIEKSAEAVSEGIVMLRNENNALPIDPAREVAVFGRIQLHYYKSGTGSGGLVNVSEVIGITEGLIRRGAKVNRELFEVYKAWEEENPFDIGSGWGNEPWSQKEMPLDDSLVSRIAEKCSTAICIIGRTAGEEQDSSAVKGAYLLSDGESEMLRAARRHFEKVIVLLNVGGIIDMNFVEEIKPDAVLYVWQGGMVGGLGTADVLIGKVSPSGKMPDTCALSVEDYPSHKYFGDTERNFYSEDIFVGYRYFETFAPEKVIYPFGFGLSYTTFDVKTVSTDIGSEKAVITVSVKNTGSASGKEVVQVYVGAPQGRLGKPVKVLCGYAKTKLLDRREEQLLTITVDMYNAASYDDSGVTGHKSCYVLEKGEYIFYVGTDVRSAEKAAVYSIDDDIIVKQLSQACAPVELFDRMKPVPSDKGFEVTFEPVPMNQVDEAARRTERLPAEIPYTGDRGFKLADVKNGKCSMEEFIAQLSDYDLSCIIRGEGMGSPKVTAGTASAFGGVAEGLAGFGIPCGCCSDGPSGMRLDCGTTAFSIPNGTLLAATFNVQLMEELFAFMGREMSANKVDCLLGPGMNIHRHPLNGRNFEYFSEDPYLTGTIASGELKGMISQGVTGTIKHFCGNNQETNRHFIDSVVSERALREIYLKGFEIAVCMGGAKTVMTTYGSVNGLWTSGNFDLDTIILRDEWGFDGFVMTDWWANINQRGQAPDKSDFAQMARAQNDVYMVCADGGSNDDNTLRALEAGTLTRAELQRNAANVCRFLMETHAMERLCGEACEIEIINRPGDDDGTDADNVVFYNIENGTSIPFGIVSKKGIYHVFALDVAETGQYKVTMTASADQGELAQLPVTIFSMGTPFGVYTFNGNADHAEVSRGVTIFSRFTTMKMYFAQSGLTVESIRFEKMD